uniref:Uncharacterized protein n=1 Tax=Ananas comosus var. bracteatus TaxID=296719 RepID=A0A6V7Q5M0_ANACO|nr:unnamed protein product [Ananas comosus var. bracteatus]
MRSLSRRCLPPVRVRKERRAHLQRAKKDSFYSREEVGFTELHFNLKFTSTQNPVSVKQTYPRDLKKLQVAKKESELAQRTPNSAAGMNSILECPTSCSWC